MGVAFKRISFMLKVLSCVLKIRLFTEMEPHASSKLLANILMLVLKLIWESSYLEVSLSALGFMLIMSPSTSMCFLFLALLSFALITDFILGSSAFRSHSKVLFCLIRFNAIFV